MITISSSKELFHSNSEILTISLAANRYLSQNIIFFSLQYKVIKNLKQKIRIQMILSLFYHLYQIYLIYDQIKLIEMIANNFNFTKDNKRKQLGNIAFEG